MVNFIESRKILINKMVNTSIFIWDLKSSSIHWQDLQYRPLMINIIDNLHDGQCYWQLYCVCMGGLQVCKFELASRVLFSQKHFFVNVIWYSAVLLLLVYIWIWMVVLYIFSANYVDEGIRLYQCGEFVDQRVIFHIMQIIQAWSGVTLYTSYCTKMERTSEMWNYFLFIFMTHLKYYTSNILLSCIQDLRTDTKCKIAY